MKNENELSEMASIILGRFGTDKFKDFWEDCYELFSFWNKNPGEMSEKETSDLQLIKTAYILSKIAEHFGKDFIKITKKAPNFWKHCEEIVLKDEEDGC